MVLSAPNARSCPCLFDGFSGPLCDEVTECMCVNQCSGHGECDSGFCKCHRGWYGTDCARRAAGLPLESGAEALDEARALDASLQSGIWADGSVRLYLNPTLHWLPGRSRRPFPAASRLTLPWDSVLLTYVRPDAPAHVPGLCGHYI